MLAPLIRKLSNKAPVALLKILGNLWPPYLFAGIRINSVTPDFRYVRVHLNFSWYNRNYVGTQFGGSIYAMTDPFYMMMLINNLGRDYIIWDKASQIQFIKPGKTRLSAEFRIDEQLLNTVVEMTKNGEKYIFDLPVSVNDTEGQIVAKVTKTLYVKRK